MTRIAPIDELADVRAEIARLRLREAQLRARVLQDPEAGQGRWFRARIEERIEQRLDPALLPERLRQDPAYLAQVSHLVVHCQPVPLQVTPLRPGWPIRRETALH